MKNTTKGNIIKGIAVVIDVAGPLAATFSQFPVWINRSSAATMSGLFLIFALLSCIPFFKQIKAYFHSPAAWVMWLILFVFFLLLNNIIEEMVLVCFIGLISNCIGAVIYKIGKIVGDKP